MDLEGDGDAPGCSNQDALQAPEADDPGGDQAQPGQPSNPVPLANVQPIIFDHNAHVTTTLPVRPADYAIKHIEAHKHILLWYFTQEGLCEAAHTVKQLDENNTLAVTKIEEGQVMVHSASSLRASKNMKLNYQLSYIEFMYAKNLFLTAINNVKWGDDAVDSFNWFFHNLLR